VLDAAAASLRRVCRFKVGVAVLEMAPEGSLKAGAFIFRARASCWRRGYRLELGAVVLETKVLCSGGPCRT
jgi:hypothetical protein